MARKRTSSGTKAWLNETDMAPRADMPDSPSTRKLGGRLRRYVSVATFTWPVLAVLVIAFGAQLITPAQGADAAASRSDSSIPEAEDLQARAVATTAVESWLATTPSPLPGGRVLSWNGSRQATDASIIEPDDRGTDVLWVHNFTLVTEDGALYGAEVGVAVDPLLGTRVASSPSLLPFVPSDASKPSVSWPGAINAATTTGVAQAVDAWAEAFVGSDPSKLRQVIGDPDGDHYYVPLTGYQLIDAKAGAGAWHPTQVDDLGAAVEDANLMMVRVELAVLPAGQASTLEDGTKASPATLTYDLLVSDANTATPRVVAWGGPGSGPDLVAYANAVIGREIQVDDNATEPTEQDTESAPQESAPAEQPAADPAAPPVEGSGS